MAISNSTVQPAPGSGGRKAERTATEQIRHLSEEIDSDLCGAKAIFDAARVLAALERARAEAKEGSLVTGEGYANGHVLRDQSLPELLEAGHRLIEQVEEKNGQIFKLEYQMRAVIHG